ncbi:hypothetical protein Y1Q_0003526 [Alligator mississippiensis]|uniref:Uncharacterized protein n=1 Tax=Alligator mississippiensis TaxID=8496 RepID=A0A151M4Q3_ALLMI|nr:hypothetical protein Y1Q_0003526 [Alligator mississippiensis]
MNKCPDSSLPEDLEGIRVLGISLQAASEICGPRPEKTGPSAWSGLCSCCGPDLPPVCAVFTRLSFHRVEWSETRFFPMRDWNWIVPTDYQLPLLTA